MKGNGVKVQPFSTAVCRDPETLALFKRWACNGCTARTSRVVVMAATFVPLCGENPLRSRLGFSTFEAGSIIVCTGDDITNRMGFQLDAGPIVWLTPSDGEPLPAYGYFAYGIKAPFSEITVWEIEGEAR